MGSTKEVIKIHNHNSFLPSFNRAALACVALLMAFAAFAVAPAFANDDETIINAGLSGPVLNGMRPSGKAVFRQRPGNDLKLEVEVEDVNLPAGTVLNVLVNNQSIGTITLGSLRAGEIELESERGQNVPQVNNGTQVSVNNQAGASLVSGVFGTNPTATPGATPSATPTPGATPSSTPTPGATPSPTPTPGATPSPTPFVMNEVEAKLSGAAINGQTPRGEAEYEIEPSGNREFKARVENVNLPVGTVLNVLIDNVKVGVITLSGASRDELKLKTEDGQTVPQVNSRTRVVVANQAGATIVAGSFSNVPPSTNPNPTPTPTPTPGGDNGGGGGEVRIEARLAGAAINGLVPKGHARFRARDGRRDFNVEIEKVNLPVGTVLGVFVDGQKVGDLVLRSTLENELELETEHGQFVPQVTNISTVVVSNAQGSTVLSGVFNTAGLAVSGNDIDNTTLFVEQHYRDFLDREPDDGGLNFWSGEIQKCGGDAACVDGMRVNTSAAFFLSIEFQETGYMLYRFNKASFGVMPRRNEFLVEMQAAAQGLVVGATGWQQKLEANKRAAADRWVASAAFQNLYGGMSNEQYVDALFANAGLATGMPERFELVEGLRTGSLTRADVLRRVADNAGFRQRESNRAFVLMQYFGYLHRNPDEGSDTDMRGFDFWLKKLDDNGGDFHRAQMVKAFIDSIEYRNRFEW
jgi:hypothetical protein